MHHQDQFRDAYCHLANTIEDIDKLCGVPNAIMTHRAMSPFAKLLWPILILMASTESITAIDGTAIIIIAYRKVTINIA